MSLLQIPGRGMYLPNMLNFTPVALSFTSGTGSLIGGATQKLALLGRIFNKDRASKNITKIHFRAGAITSAGGSTARISLQDIDNANGPVGRPDGTQDQTVDVLLSALTASTWNTTAALSANRTIANGDKLACVFEYQSFAGADSLEVSQTTASNSGAGTDLHVAKFSGASWSQTNCSPNIIFENDDGTFSTFDGSFPASALGTIAFGSSSAADEIGLEFQFPFDCAVDGVWVWLLTGTNTNNFDTVLYDNANSALVTVSTDINNFSSLNSYNPLFIPFSSEINISANTIYRIVIKPTTTGTVTLQYFDVSNANHLTCHDGGTNFKYTSRVDAGSFSSTSTRRPLMGIRISSISSGAGGLLRNAGMSGGIEG